MDEVVLALDRFRASTPVPLTEDVIDATERGAAVPQLPSRLEFVVVRCSRTCKFDVPVVGPQMRRFLSAFYTTRMFRRASGRWGHGCGSSGTSSPAECSTTPMPTCVRARSRRG